MGNIFLNLTLLIIFHFSLTTFSMNLTTILTDQSALLAFKDRVVHDPQNVLATNWSSSSHVCNWFGVSCGFKHRRVTALDLTGLGLVGTLPPHLGNLSFLSLLSISDNSFHGRLPVQLSNLHRLKHIDLGNNSFSGEIPSWLGSLTELRVLRLYFKNFNGVIPLSLGYLPKVEELSLYGNQLSGSIPSSIFNISSVQVIDLGTNMFTGSIPFVPTDLLSLELINFNFNNLTGHFPNDTFDRLPNLKEFSSSVNMLCGRIPTSLFKCRKLQTLSLSRNQLEGSVPVEIGNLSMLQFFSIGQNHFQGEIPEQIVNLTLLRLFDCSHNNFTGMIPQQIGNLKILEFLNLEDNKLVGPIPPAIFNTSTLNVISLLLNQLSGSLPSNMGIWLPNLEGLYMGNNQLFGPFPMYISNASKLTILDMSHNYISGSIPDTLGNLKNLKKLNLEVNNLTSSGMSFLSSLTNCRGLELLDFGSNQLISGKLPGSVGNFSDSLQVFFGARCNIRGSIPYEFGNLSHLMAIKLDGNKLTGTVPTTIGGLKELQSLSLSGNKLEGWIPSELCQLNKLGFLVLTNNKMSGPIPTCLGDVVSLRQLLLGSNMFSSSIPSTLTGLNDLLILNLSSNSLTGPLPIDIGNWKVVTSMDLSNNQFSSDIPTGVADLNDLTYFSLSNNRITGSIPDSFGDLLSLETLDLSRNSLSGEIPKSLEKLRYLKYFNVSFNRLQGEIPNGGSFGNYSIESFEGNAALCGAAQLHVPSCKTKPHRNSKARTKLITCVAPPIASTILVVALIIIFFRSRKKKVTFETQEELLPLGMWRRFAYPELYQATDGFSESRLLGSGSYGSVYQGTLPDGMTFAVKVFKLDLKGAFKSFDVECEVLRNTRHRNLTKIISRCSDNLDFRALILEFMPNGSLDKWLYSSNHFLDILQRLNILIDVASALEYLHHGHTTPVVHCDLKPSNVLLDEDMVAHLTDFGIAKLLCEEDSMIQTMTLAKPTDEMFSKEMSLRRLAIETLTSMLNQVGDTNFVSTARRNHLAANICALSVLQVALECSEEIPCERLSMKEVITKLEKIKDNFLKDIE
ncbi:LRR receptor-like serine/threonine-protein kinase EFR [Hibiscus syriacus]|uniref:LRR receptor-like serine/threonine-protein kinase EFR n=1 Tax=Hibiscus syriacus TaxID=106335 RepID=UPI001923BA6B|nr:LRR receptor-like serine/threonine-protein kinase EFR [Hibiscus syriacus]